MAPDYLCKLVPIRMSSSEILLQVPVSQLKSYGDCAFSVATRTLWNSLPVDIRSVLSLENFKADLFKVAFTDNHYRLNPLLGFYRPIIWCIAVQCLWLWVVRVIFVFKQKY